jgi:DNA-binding CsgD family transcriptional regulator
MHDGVWIGRDGRPAAADPAAQQALHPLVADTVETGRGRSAKCASRLSIRRRQSAAPLEAMVYPLPTGAAGQTSAAAVFVFDPERIESPDTQVLGSIYGLTGTEAKLAASLARGESLEDYCQANRVTANTARAHLKRVLAKTGIHRQAQLVSLLARLPKTGALAGH